MGWRVQAERLETVDCVAPYRVFQDARFTRSVVLQAIRTWIVFYNLPVFTNLRVAVYRDNGSGGPGELIGTSVTQWSLNKITAKVGAIAELYFKFSPELTLIGGDLYHFALYGEGYVGNAGSHIAWVRGVADPVYPGTLNTNITKTATVPFKVGFFGAEL